MQQDLLMAWRSKLRIRQCGFVWKCRVPLYPMVLLIIIPFLNGYNWEYTLFSESANVRMVGRGTSSLMGCFFANAAIDGLFWWSQHRSHISLVADTDTKSHLSKVDWLQTWRPLVRIHISVTMIPSWTAVSISTWEILIFWKGTRPGKHTKHYGKSPLFNGKTHYKWPCSIAMLVYQRVLGKPFGTYW